MRIKLPITQEDIDGGHRRRSMSCPIARSMLRHGLWFVSVGIQFALARCDDGRECAFMLEEDAMRFRSDYDEGAGARPGVITLRRIACNRGSKRDEIQVG